nr:UPF0236 family protein [Thermoanaerobacterium sp. RBIITD]
MNGDGVSWIKQCICEEGVYYQLDLFHKSQAVIKNVENKKEAHELIKMLNEGRDEESLGYIAKLIIKQKDDEKKKAKLERFKNYKELPLYCNLFFLLFVSKSILNFLMLFFEIVKSIANHIPFMYH